MTKRLHKESRGFTIVELMIATLIFSIVLLLCAFAISHVGRMYYKGVIIGRTQDTARKVTEEISQTLQFAAGDDDPSIFMRTGTRTESGVPIESYCLGTTRYSFTRVRSLGTAANQSDHVLWRDINNNAGTCEPVNITQASLTGGEELLGENMRLPHFAITESNGLWSIDISVTFGDDPTLYEDDTAVSGPEYEFCKGTTAGGQFCAVSAFSTSVTRRL